MQVGRNIDALSGFKDLSKEQETQIQTMMDHVYEDFIRKVAVGRRKSFDEIRQLAKGKIYSGQQAAEV